MKFEQSPLYVEAANVINSGVKDVHGYYYAILYVKKTGKTIQAHKLTNVDIIRDFLNNYADEIHADLYLSAGTYENDIIPNKEDIEVRIFYQSLSEHSSQSDPSKDVKVIYGRAVLKETKNAVFSLQHSGNSQAVRDLTAIQKVPIQILHPLIEVFRMTSVGGIYRNTVGTDLIRFLFMNVSSKADIDQRYKTIGVDIAPGFNPEVKNHLAIPMGIKAIDVPDYINKSIDGIYPTGMGFYLVNQLWYLYPTYDVERFQKSKKTLTLIRVPTNAIPVTDRSFLYKDGNLTVLVNKEIEFHDRSDIAQQNLGNGLRVTDGRNIVEDFAKIDGNKATIVRAKNVNEFIIDKRETGLNNVTSTATKITSNLFYEMSKMAPRGGSVLDVVWDYSDSSYIYPGMPCRFLMLQGGGVVTVYGVVLGCHEMIALDGRGLNASKHKRVTHLSIFVKRKYNWNEQAE